MKTAPSTVDEQRRLATLKACGILDTAPEPDFDGLTALASQIAGTPLALVSLVDDDRQWFKSRVGPMLKEETPRDVAFCAHAILSPDEPFIVPDARRDPRFFDNPLVTGAPYIAFYGAIPLVVGEDRQPLGTLCVMDRIPRALSADKVDALKTLAHQVEILLELRLRQRQLEQSLSRSYRQSQQLESILDSLFEGVLIHDAERRLLTANAAALRMLPIPDASGFGTYTLPEWDVVRPDGTPVPNDETPAAVALATGQVVRSELLGLRTGQGERRWLLVSARPVPASDDDSRRAVLTSFTDVSDLRRTEEQWRAAESTIDSIFASALDLHCAIDATGRFTLVNQAAWERTLGLAASDLLGRHFNEFVHADDRGPTEAAAQRVMSGEPVVSFENRVPTRWGSLRTMQWSAVCSPAQQLMFASGRDVTEQREREEDLRRAKRAAEAATTAKSAFLASMSHEIRTPMAGVIGMLNLLLDSHLDDNQLAYAKASRASAESLLAVLNDVLDFSKIEAGRLSIERVAFDPAGIIREGIALFAVAARDKGIPLNCTLDLPQGIALLGDPGRVRQVLLNLLSNAVKFTQSGSIDVRGHVEPAAQGAAMFVISVRDTGVGISPDVQARLFEPFVQADSGTARRYGGTGLGLAISRRLCELMGGQIDVQSELGRGSTFSMRVRCDSTQQLRESPTASPVPMRAYAGHVLVVEDDPVNALVATRLLKKLGLSSELVTSGVDAVPVATEHHFDLVLMDIQMPDLDGLEATRRIRAEEAADRRMPIIALTANVFDEDRLRCIDAGMDDFLSKPLSLSALSGVLDRWLAATAASQAS